MTAHEEMEATLRAFGTDEAGEEIIQSLAELAGYDGGDVANVKLGVGPAGFDVEIAGPKFNVKLTISPKE